MKRQRNDDERDDCLQSKIWKCSMISEELGLLESVRVHVWDNEDRQASRASTKKRRQ